MTFPFRFRTATVAMPAVLAVLLALGGCESLGRKKEQAPVLHVPANLALPGTMVVYMPKIVSSAKQQSGDPIYVNWATALMDYVDESMFVQRIIDQGRLLDAKTHISSKTIPSSDYSILLVGAKSRAVHVQEPWQSVELFLLLDPYLRGDGTAKNLPPGCEAVKILPRTESLEGAGSNGGETGLNPAGTNAAQVEKGQPTSPAP